MKLATIFSPRGLRVAIPAMLAALVAAGVAFSRVEADQDMRAWDGIWWALTTVTTVGYGDVVPRTDAGRAIGAGVIVIGVGFLFLMTAAFVEHFIRAEIRRDVAEEIERDVEEIVAPEREILRRLEALSASIDAVERRLARMEDRLPER